MEEALAAEAAKHTTALEAALAAERCAQMWPHMQSAVLGHCVQSELHCPLLQFQRSFRCPAGRTEGWIRCDDGGGEGISSMIYAPLSISRSLSPFLPSDSDSVSFPPSLSLALSARSLSLIASFPTSLLRPACLPASICHRMPSCCASVPPHCPSFFPHCLALHINSKELF